jgi:acyl-CoA synthetase (NDP forming)
MHRVNAPQELVDLAQALLGAGSPRGRRVAVLTDGGGHAAIAASLAGAAGLELPALSLGMHQTLRAGLPATAAVANPIDLAGGGERDLHSYDRTVRTVLGSGEVDAMLMTGYFGGYTDYEEAFGAGETTVAEALADAVADSGRPLVVQTMYPGAAASSALRRRGVPVYDTIERAVGVLARLAGRAERESRGVPALPPPAEPVGGAGYMDARALLAAGGVPFEPARVVSTAAGAVSAAAGVGYPVVLKALGTLHKSDAGGVVLGLRDEEAVAAAFADLSERLAPPAVVIERMAPLDQGVELLVGTRWDARFGPVALVGLGGVFTEVLRDVAVALAPVEEPVARELLLSLRAAPLLGGARGRPPVDLDAAASAVAALSRVAAAHPEIAEIEMNPLLALPDGAVGLDARIVPRVADQA